MDSPFQYVNIMFFERSFILRAVHWNQIDILQCALHVTSSLNQTTFFVSRLVAL